MLMHEKPCLIPILVIAILNNYIIKLSLTTLATESHCSDTESPLVDFPFLGILTFHFAINTKITTE